MKVQRPGVKESIALDIYILRSLAVVIRRVRKINSDLGEILDEVEILITKNELMLCNLWREPQGTCLEAHLTRVACECQVLAGIASSIGKTWISSNTIKATKQADGFEPLQWAESLFRELDYRREARNGIRFRELYGDLEVDFFYSQSLESSPDHCGSAAMSK